MPEYLHNLDRVGIGQKCYAFPVELSLSDYYYYSPKQRYCLCSIRFRSVIEKLVSQINLFDGLHYESISKAPKIWFVSFSDF